ncbi:hypothetical protein [Burkholderia gladioli]|uniref:hypothetical protein n=1 Tax=Burkholderia gladioli TaxID=28095 RepID=UPI00163E4865|nr:hypothetical protein [Burkholderia gladioli]
MNENGKAKLIAFEVTAAGFNGGTDATDGRVFWVLATSPDEVLIAIDGTGATFHGSIDIVRDGDIDFRLPQDWLPLRASLARVDSLIGKLSRAHLKLSKRYREANSRLCSEIKAGQSVPEERVLECIRLRTRVDRLFWAMEMLPGGQPPMSSKQGATRISDDTLSKEISEARDLFRLRIADITAALTKGDLSLAQFPRVGEEAVSELTEAISVLREILQIVPDPEEHSQPQKPASSGVNVATPLTLVPHGRFIRDGQNRMIAEMFQPGDSVAEQEAIKRRIVRSFNTLPDLIGVLLRADKEDAISTALYNEGITDAYDVALAEAVSALGDDGIAVVAQRYELDPEAIRRKIGRA